VGEAHGTLGQCVSFFLIDKGMFRCLRKFFSFPSTTENKEEITHKYYSSGKVSDSPNYSPEHLG
jgi:hypothetical protein